MRIFAIVLLVTLTHAAAARGQGTIYVAGDAFGDLRRVSSTTGTTSTTLDGNTAGGGVRIGAFLAPRWTLELGVDLGGTTEGTVSLSDNSAPTSPTLPSPPIIQLRIDQHSSTRIAATSVLVGYHPPARGRLRAGFRGGLSFMRSSGTITTMTGYISTDPRVSLIGFPTTTTTTESAINDIAATVAGEVAIALSSHAAIVPEMRVHGYGGRVVLRPGVAVRWLF